MEKREPSYTVGGNANWYNLYGEQYGVFFKKTKNRTNMWSNNPTTGHKTGENHKFRKIHASQCSYNSREMEATLMSIDC